MTLKTWALAAVSAAALAIAGDAAAAPTAQCLWQALTPAERTSLTDQVTNNQPLGEVLRARVVTGMQTCGFESAESGAVRAGFLLAMMAYRTRVEVNLQTASITPAVMARAYTALDRPFHEQLIAFARSRFTNTPPSPPDQAKLTALMTRVNATTPEARSAVQSYLLIRAMTELAESQGAAFTPPQRPATAPAPAPTAAPPAGAR